MAHHLERVNVYSSRIQSLEAREQRCQLASLLSQNLPSGTTRAAQLILRFKLCTLLNTVAVVKETNTQIVADELLR
jgi:hypothetical protein